MGQRRLQGLETDTEDNVLKEMLIAGCLLELNASGSEGGRASMLQLAYPVLVGRQQPQGQPDYPKMGSFFQLQAGGGWYPAGPSHPTECAVARFQREWAQLSPEMQQEIEAWGCFCCGLHCKTSGA